MATLAELGRAGYYFAKRRHWKTNHHTGSGLCINIITLEYIKFSTGTGTRPSPDTRNRDDFIPCECDGTPIPIKANVEQIRANQKIKAEEQMMNNRNVNYVGGEYKVVEVEYIDSASGKYCFKMDIDIEVAKDDLLVVESKNGLGMVKVIDVIANFIENADKINKATAWVVCKIDMSRQNQRKDATKKRAYLIKQLDERKQAVEAVGIYEAIAASDPKAKALLEELKGIDTINLVESKQKAEEE